MELISKEVVKQIINSGRTREQMLGMVDCAVTFDSSTDSSTASLAVFEQAKWERDIAIKQLEELGYGLGE